MRHRMRQMRTLSASIVLAAAASLVPAALARADDENGPQPEFLLGVGYSRVVFSGGGIVLNDEDAVHFDPALTFAPFESLPQLRVGGDVGFTAGLDDVGGSFSSGSGGAVAAVESNSELFLFQPEFVVSWRQPLGREDVGFYLEPGVAVGGTFAWINFDDSAASAGAYRADRHDS